MNIRCFCRFIALMTRIHCVIYLLVFCNGCGSNKTMNEVKHAEIKQDIDKADNIPLFMSFIPKYDLNTLNKISPEIDDVLVYGRFVPDTGVLSATLFNKQALIKDLQTRTWYTEQWNQNPPVSIAEDFRLFVMSSGRILFTIKVYNTGNGYIYNIHDTNYFSKTTHWNDAFMPELKLKFPDLHKLVE